MPLSSGASKNVAGDESYSPKSSAKSIYRLADKVSFFSIHAVIVRS